MVLYGRLCYIKKYLYMLSTVAKLYRGRGGPPISYFGVSFTYF